MPSCREYDLGCFTLETSFAAEALAYGAAYKTIHNFE